MPALLLSLRDIEMVVTVAEQETLSRGARALHVTTSALSHRLRLLELRLGSRLFDRRGRRLVLNPAGERLLRAGIPMLRDVRHLQYDLQEIGRTGKRLLRIGTEAHTSYHWLPRVLAQFRIAFPDVEVQIRPDFGDDPTRCVRDGELDLAIVHTIREQDGVRFFPLFRDEVVLALAPQHHLAGRAFIEPRELESEHLITYAGNGQTQAAVLETGFEVRARQVSAFPLTELIIDLVKTNLGVSVLAKWVIAPQLAHGELACVRLTESGWYRAWYAAYSDAADTPNYVHSFVELLFRQPFSSFFQALDPAAQVSENLESVR